MAIKTTVIPNDDGTTGYVQSANKYQLSQDWEKKYELLKALSAKPKNDLKKITAGGTKGKETIETGDTRSPSIMNFLTKMQKFYFAPPSDNLWTVEIDLMDSVESNTSRLGTLYNAITSANTWWESIVNTKWKIDTSAPQKKGKNTPSDFIEQFCTTSGVFLAQNINFTPHAATITESVFSEAQQHSGFLNFGFVAQNRQINRSLKISFLVSNWDIGDILFDKWIAAVAQRGLTQIGTQNSSLKARIIVKEYSAGIPKEFNDGNSNTKMECRKEYIFENCVPVNRGSVEKSYEFNNAGTFKNNIVEFKYEDYKIKYLI